MYDLPFPIREPEVCRVYGLSSVAGLLLNGLCGKVLSVHDPRDKPGEERVPVKLDGIPDIKSLRRSNLDIAPARDCKLGWASAARSCRASAQTRRSRPYTRAASGLAPRTESRASGC